MALHAIRALMNKSKYGRNCPMFLQRLPEFFILRNETHRGKFSNEWQLGALILFNTWSNIGQKLLSSRYKLM